MALTKEKKAKIISHLKGFLGKSKSVVFVNFRGLTVAMVSELRRVLKSAGVKYYVAKKTLTRIALKDSKIPGEQPELPGELAIVYGDDIMAPSREINEFIKKFPENLKILGGIFDGRFRSQPEMVEIAAIPALPVLYGKFVNIINSPIQRFVIGLSEIAKAKN